MSTAPSSVVAKPSVVKAVLGKGVLFKGQIQSRYDLLIEGEVEGTIEMMEHRLTIAAEGNVRASVRAREIEIFGSLAGKAEASDKVYIRKGAKFVGDIHSAGIVIEDGGYIKGNIDLSKQLSESQMESTIQAVPHLTR
jgi:cytoskeletal protein CcmA (bactofilin family)